MAPTLVQSKSGTATSGTSLTITLTSSTTAHNCLVVNFGSTASTTNPNVSGITIGGSADHFTRARQNNAAAVANADIWVDRDCVGGQTSVVVTFSAGTGTGIGIGCWVEEWSGVDTSSPVDAVNGATGTSTTWSSGSTGTLAQASEVVTGCVFAFSTTLTTPAAPWTELGTLTAGTNNRFAAGWQVVSATTAQTFNSTTTGTSDWAAVVVTLKASTSVTGTGGLTLGGLGFAAAGSIASGKLTLGGLRFAGTGAQKFTGTGGLALGGLGFTGGQTTVVPAVPTEPAGVIATSKDLNGWANAATFFLGSSRGTQPMFFLQAATTQALTTSFTAVNYSASAPVFKDNNGAWSSGNPSRVTIMTPGFYTISYSVSAASGAAHLQCYAQVTTGAANPFNPSTTLKFQESNRAATTNVVVSSSSGLVPIYLASLDYLEVYALVGTAENTSLTFAPQLTGEWVSS